MRRIMTVAVLVVLCPGLYGSERARSVAQQRALKVHISSLRSELAERASAWQASGHEKAATPKRRSA